MVFFLSILLWSKGRILKLHIQNVRFKTHETITLVHTISELSLLFYFSELDTKAQNLSILSQKYKKDATYLNMKSMYMKAAAGAVVVFVFVMYFWIL